MKVIFMGTPQIAVPTLKRLYENGYDIKLVVTQPDKPKGRGNKLQISPIKEYALSKGLKIYQPEKLKGNTEAYNILKDLEPDFFVVAAYGKILPKEILDIPKQAPVNLHFSLLPKYRGAAPVNWAIINGDDKSGVSTMLMDIGMDTGDILLIKESLIGKKNAEELSEELSIIGANLLIETLQNFNNITPQKQDENLVSTAPIMKKDDGKIDWNRSAIDIERMIRGFTPWPGCYTYLGEKLLKIYSAKAIETKYNGKIGKIMAIGKDDFIVSTGSGVLQVKEIQLEGKKRMSVKNFLTGFSLSEGMDIG